MSYSGMQPLTSKELEYISDSLSNEDLLIKQSAATIASSTNPTNVQVLTSMVHAHQQHMNILLNALQQHAQLAPTQPQQNGMQQ